MKKIIYAAPKKGGKTKWLIENIIKENLAGKHCYYLGGRKIYERLCEKLAKEDPSKYMTPETHVTELTFDLINKEVGPKDNNCAVFTDDVLWEMTAIFPYSVRNMIPLDTNWYVTVGTEGNVYQEKVKQ